MAGRPRKPVAINKKHFSKEVLHLITKEEQETMDFGTKVHEVLELLDFKNPDFSSSNIPVNIIDKVKEFLNTDLIKENINSNLYKEYDRKLKQYGLLDYDDIFMYPNPVKDVLFVESKGINKIEIYNSIGQKLMEINNRSSREKVDIDCSSLKKGLFLLHIIYEDKRVGKSFIRLWALSFELWTIKKDSEHL